MKKWLMHFLTASRDGEEDVRSKYLLNATLGLVMVVGSFVLWYFLRDKYFTAFSPFAYWNLSDQGFFKTLWQIATPLCLYAVLIGQLDWFSDDELEDGTIIEEDVIFKSFISFCAGLIEEMGHRGIYIYLGLISVSINNFIFSAIFFENIVLVITAFVLVIYAKIIAIPWLLYVVPCSLMTAFALIQQYISSRNAKNAAKCSKHRVSKIALFLRIVMFTVWAGYAFPRGVETLLGMLNPAESKSFSFISGGADKWTALLYVSAIMWSNIKFRNGHKYQGPYGMFSSYVFGMYMIYIAFTYGLMYAIALHFIYDALLFGSEHFVQVIKNRNLVGKRGRIFIR